MIGIVGGTFDPVHYGHLRPALEIQQALGMRQMRFVPSRVPPHRAVPGATAQQRLAMLELALHEMPSFVVDQRELARTGPSYMVDTLVSMRQEFADEPLALVLGLDAFIKVDTWYQWPCLLELAHIVVSHRPGSYLPQEGTMAALLSTHGCECLADMQGQPNGRIWLQEVTQLDISATKIRAAVKACDSVRFLTSESVRKYIETQSLYF